QIRTCFSAPQISNDCPSLMNRSASILTCFRGDRKVGHWIVTRARTRTPSGKPTRPCTATAASRPAQVCRGLRPGRRHHGASEATGDVPEPKEVEVGFWVVREAPTACGVPAGVPGLKGVVVLTIGHDTHDPWVVWAPSHDSHNSHNYLLPDRI